MWNVFLNCHSNSLPGFAGGGLPPGCLRGNQSGAALLIVLVVVLLVSLLATSMSGEYLLLSRTLENQQTLQQARSWLRGAESVAREALLLDLAGGSRVDSELELWGRPLELTLPTGRLVACLVDLQGRLDLNDLADAAPAGFSVAQKRFIRLLQVVDPDNALDQIAATSLANAVFDWVDADNQPRYPGGAEFTDYLQDPDVGRPANQSFADVSELRLVRGMTPALVTALTPWLSVWGNGFMNLNSIDSQLVAQRPAPMDGLSGEGPQAVLLRTLNNGESLLPLSEQGADEIAARRRAQGGVVENFELFGQGMLAFQQWELDGLGLTSEYFQLNARARIGGRNYGMQTVLERSADLTGRPAIRVRSRTFDDGPVANTPGALDCVAALP
jgi:general secretion pathway protein K